MAITDNIVVNLIVAAAAIAGLVFYTIVIATPDRVVDPSDDQNYLLSVKVNYIIFWCAVALTILFYLQLVRGLFRGARRMWRGY